MRLPGILLAGIVITVFTACKKDIDPIIVVPPLTGAEVELNGLIGSEAGSAAGNSVYLDLSSGVITPASKSKLGSWFLLRIRFQGNT